ncbi:MAG: serine/threonine-protein kinase [Polyangia bacterium]
MNRAKYNEPDNVFLVSDSEAPGGERIKLLDFGIAKMADEYRGSVRTQVNVIMGTPAYMAPEQCRGSKGVADKTDVYALGVMLFEMMAGRPPFVAAEPGEYLALHMLQAPPSLREFVQGLPEGLTQLVERMLAKDPAARPTMAEVASLLRRFSSTSGDLAPLIAGAGHASDAAVTTEAEPVSGSGSAPGSRTDGVPDIAMQTTVTSEANIAPPPRSPPPRAPSPLPYAYKGPPGVSGSSPVWVPMEIVKTDYSSAPELRLKTPQPRRIRRLSGRLPPGFWLMLLFTAGAVVLALFRLFRHTL